jgi:TolA-binding protein
MHPGLRIGLLTVLVVAAVFLGVRFGQSYSEFTERSAGRYDSELTRPQSVAASQIEATAPSPDSTGSNQTPFATTTTNPPTHAAATHLTSDGRRSDAPADPGGAESTAAGHPAASNRRVSMGYGKVMGYGAALVAVALVLAFLVAHEITQFAARRAGRLLFNEEAAPSHDPEYELAEQEWAKGQYLQAIQHLRDYLRARPREVHAAIRIAEIYEKDLKNYLAAALEYEEILKLRLSPERWGWAAIHLANLYSGKLNQPEKALALLRRIDAECGDTPPAQKARDRLAAYDAAGGQATGA